MKKLDFMIYYYKSCANKTITGDYSAGFRQNNIYIIVQIQIIIN